MNFLDNFLNNITMYRLVLYVLIAYFLIAAVFSFFGLLPFTPLELLGSTIFILAVCLFTNITFSYVFKTPANVESVYITSFILTLIITPSIDFHRLQFTFWASVLAISSKFILAIKKKHVFNPAALGVFVASLGIVGSASWWIGTSSMMAVILIGGLLVVKKIDRWDLVLSFFGVSLPIIFITTILNGNDLLTIVKQIFLDSPILFFAFIMLTEPLTSPPKKLLRILFGSLVGLIFIPQLHIGSFYTTPELALLFGNIFAYLVSPKERLILKLKEKIKLAENIYDFVFALDRKFAFTPGQYMEWTLGHKNSDSRGNRRYFTLASSPTEDNLRIGVRLNTPSSSFKNALVNLNIGQEISTSSLSGEFTIDKNKNEKLVFIAGGIGITPFRSIIKNIIDTNSKADIVLFYSVKDLKEAVYLDVFKQAENLGVRTFVAITDIENIPNGWIGISGIITKETIEKYAPDFKERHFYLSGPHGMVTAFEKTLKDLGLKKSQIKTDYFPGFA